MSCSFLGRKTTFKTLHRILNVPQDFVINDETIKKSNNSKYYFGSLFNLSKETHTYIYWYNFSVTMLLFHIIAK